MKHSRLAPCLSSGSHTSVATSADLMRSGGMITLFQRWMDRERPPARIKAELAADLLGFQPDDMAVLALNEILVPLGNPTANAVKYYATVDVAAFSEDRDRFDQATAIIYSRHRSKFEAQKDRSPESPDDVNG